MKNRIIACMRLLVGIGFVLSLLGGASLQAKAAPTDLFISEYIEGGSYNKAIEIFNGTGETIDLSAGGYNIFMSFKRWFDPPGVLQDQVNSQV